jgi:hypothetical protein
MCVWMEKQARHPIMGFGRPTQVGKSCVLLGHRVTMQLQHPLKTLANVAWALGHIGTFQFNGTCCPCFPRGNERVGDVGVGSV